MIQLFLSDYSSCVLLLVISLAAFAFLRWKQVTYSVFKAANIPGPEPIPIFGNAWNIWKKVLPEYDQQLYQKYGKIFGTFDGATPVINIAEPDIIRNIFVKDFDHFINRRNFSIKNRIFRKFITIAVDREWKAIRAAISPAFSSGKIKRMSVIMEECSRRLVSSLKESIAKGDGIFEAKNEFGTYTMDVIASCCFGVDIKGGGENSSKFVDYASFLFGPNLTSSPLAIIPFILPWLGRYTFGKMIKLKQWQFFISITEALVKQRVHSNISYNDFIEMSLEAASETAKKGLLNSEEVQEIVIAQSLLFFLAGYDTTGTTLTLTAYSLALNQNVQDKLREEVMNKIDENNGVLDHNVANSIEYIDQVINEVLRLYPPAIRVERLCNKAVTYDKLHIPKGMIVNIPLYPLHRDPQYFPNPEKFDPDRFSPDRKRIIHPNAFMPFGSGPRNCVGMRFALEEIRLALCAIIKEFRIELSEKTEVPITFPKGFSAVLQPRNVFLKLELLE